MRANPRTGRVPRFLPSRTASEPGFNEEFHMVRPSDFSALRQITEVDDEENLWRMRDQIVCPMDSVKPIDSRRGWSYSQVLRYNRERFLDLISAGWDLVIIDEAHRLVGPDTNAVQSEERSNPKAYASRIICRMLAECRKRRVLLALADQSPSAIATEIIRMTRTQVVFCLTQEADRDQMAGAMLFGSYEYEHIARLLPGRAFLFTEGFHKSRLIEAVDLREKIDYDTIFTSRELHDLICDEPWYRAARLISESTRLEQLARKLATLDARRSQFALQEARLCCQYVTQRVDRKEA
jgi:hypothetical protein